MKPEEKLWLRRSKGHGAGYLRHLLSSRSNRLQNPLQEFDLTFSHQASVFYNKHHEDIEHLHLKSFYLSTVLCPETRTPGIKGRKEALLNKMCKKQMFF